MGVPAGDGRGHNFLPVTVAGREYGYRTCLAGAGQGGSGAGGLQAAEASGLHQEGERRQDQDSNTKPEPDSIVDPLYRAVLMIPTNPAPPTAAEDLLALARNRGIF
ncbi:uncharacterized protein LOC111255690 [Setaria italica]|uniref:uncharacterized protein LOC111255690 n=1 Tax=Setaria italica TaxID=4555 RepID=UPI000BE578C4|nr:uncharacterized protein LOC111255690 [Setaria italica]